MDLGFVSGAGVVGGRVTSGSVCRDAKRGVVTMSASRRDVLKIALGAAAALVFPVGSALADGSVSYGTRVRARGLYGSKIMQLETSVTEIPALVEGQQWVQLLRLISSSDKKPGTIYTNLNAFQLYKTGYFADSRPKQKTLTQHQTEFDDALASLEKAAKNKDKTKASAAAADLQKAYYEYINAGELKANEFQTEPGQAWSSDYDFRRKL